MAGERRHKRWMDIWIGAAGIGSDGKKCQAKEAEAASIADAKFHVDLRESPDACLPLSLPCVSAFCCQALPAFHLPQCVARVVTLGQANIATFLNRALAKDIQWVKLKIVVSPRPDGLA